MQRIAIINSRQALRPTGATDWVRATSRAVKTLCAEDDYIFLSSLGEVTCELTLSCLSSVGATVEIILTDYQARKYSERTTSLQHYLTAEFRLSATLARILRVEDDTTDIRLSPHIRDREILHRADVIVPISIRPGGFWESHLAENPALSAKVDNRFAVAYQKSHTSVKQHYDHRQLNSNTAGHITGHLIHWTRATNHPWPGETRWKFYHDLSEAQGIYPRSALATLRHMLSEKLVRGSTRHMPSGIALVSLTSASLAESALLMKYRARYREMTIEPYAIAIPLEAAKRLGACQIIYGSPKELAQLSDTERLFAHSRGSNGASWEHEKEWRIKGDVDLTSLWRELIVIVENQSEAIRIEREFGLRTLPVFEE